MNLSVQSHTLSQGNTKILTKSKAVQAKLGKDTNSKHEEDHICARTVARKQL